MRNSPFVILICLFCAALSASGQTQSKTIRGMVREAFTNCGVEDALVAVSDMNGKILSTATTAIPMTAVGAGGGMYQKNKNEGAEFLLSVPAAGKYVVTVSMMGYEADALHVDATFKGRKTVFDMGDIYLIPVTQQLDDVTVSVTKIKMFYRGDTLIYNADAFVVDKRNMLEDLVKQLPGVELRDGQVFANGRFVEDIVIGGKDFFKNAPMTTMKMLPAYVVDKLKFYDMEGETSKTMGRDMHDQRFVMDVLLKRDYHGAWLGSAEVGGGSHDRWETLLFGMRFDDRQFLSVSIDANNINKEREANDLCTVETTEESQLLTNKSVIANYAFYPSEKFNLNLLGKVKRQDTERETEERAEVYLPSASQFRWELNQGRSKAEEYSGGLSLSLRPRKGLFFSGNYSFQYSPTKGQSTVRSVTSDTREGASETVCDSLFSAAESYHNQPFLNAVNDQSLNDAKEYVHKASVEAHIARNPDLLRLKADFNDVHSGNRLSQQYRYLYSTGNTSQTQFRNKYYDTEAHCTTANLSAEYLLKLSDREDRSAELTPYYSCTFRRERDDRPLYRLDQLEGWGFDSRQVLGALPSSRDSLLRCIDAENSRWSTEQSWTHSVGLRLTHEVRLRADSSWLKLSAHLPLSFKKAEIDYRRMDDRQNKRHHFALLQPELSIGWNPAKEDRRGSVTAWLLTYKMTQTEPSIHYLLDTRDDSDPLNIFVSNPGLHKQTSHSAALSFRHQHKKTRHSMHAEISGSALLNAIAIASYYNAQTGARQYSPVNVDGNHTYAFNVGYSLPANAAQTVWLSATAKASRIHSVDMMAEEEASSLRSSVDSHQWGGSAALRMELPRIGASRLVIDCKSSVDVRHLNAATYSGSNVTDWSNRILLTTDLPWEISLSASCNLISRFGYSASQLNKTVAIANASISKSFPRDKLTLELRACDIFHQNSIVRIKLNEQGRYETFVRKYIPSYLMLAIRYHFSSARKD